MQTALMKEAAAVAEVLAVIAYNISLTD